MIPATALLATDDFAHMYFSYERNDINQRWQTNNPANPSSYSDFGAVALGFGGVAGGALLGARIWGGKGETFRTLGRATKAMYEGIGGAAKWAGKGAWEATKGYWGGFKTFAAGKYGSRLGKNFLKGAVFGSMFTPGIGFASNFLIGGGKFGAAAGVVGSGISFGFDAYRFYDEMITQKMGPAAAAGNLVGTWANYSIGGLVGGAIGQALIPVPVIGGMIGAAVGSMGLDYLSNNPTVIDFLNTNLGTHLINRQQVSEAAMTGGQGYYYRNPFSPNSYGMLNNNQYTATLRQASLQALQNSPLGSRARLLGNEAARISI